MPEGVRVHLKLDTGMGRWGLSELPRSAGRGRRADEPPRDGRLRSGVRPGPDRALRGGDRGLGHLIRHIANSAAALRIPESHFDAARCGIALYGLSPFGEPPAVDGLEPVLRWESHLAQVRRLDAGESTGYRRAFVADEPTWVGIVPVGYADGFRRDLTGTEVRVDGEPRRVVGVSMDALAVELDRELPGRHAGHARRARGAARGSRAGRGHDQLRARLRIDTGPTRARRVCSMRELAQEVLAGEEAWVVGGAVRDELLAATSSISTSPAASRRRRRGRTRSARAAPRFRSPSGTAPGESRSTADERSTSRRCPTGSRTTSRRGTSRSTRSRFRSPAVIRSTRTAGATTSTRS